MMTGRPDSNRADFGDHFLDRARLRLGLADDGEVEAPRQAAELVAGAGKAGAERERLGRDAGARGRLVEPLDRGLRRGRVLALLHLDHVGRDVAGAGDRNDRVVEEGEPRDMGLERGGDRDREVAGRSGAFADAEIDDNVFDQGTVFGHGSVSSRRSRAGDHRNRSNNGLMSWRRAVLP